MFLIAMDDEVRPLQLLSHLAVSEDAGEFQDAVLAGVEAGHFEVDPEEFGGEVQHQANSQYISEAKTPPQEHFIDTSLSHAAYFDY